MVYVAGALTWLAVYVPFQLYAYNNNVHVPLWITYGGAILWGVMFGVIFAGGS